MNLMTERARKGEVRWRVLQILYANAPNATKQEWITGAMLGLELQTDRLEVIKELAYLASERKRLVEPIDKGTLGLFWVLTSDGVDYIEYNVSELPGIPRPEVS